MFYPWSSAGDFFASRGGRALLAAVFVMTLVILVFQFFRWDGTRREAVVPGEGSRSGETGSGRPAGPVGSASFEGPDL